jgi:hypothetical protein
MAALFYWSKKMAGVAATFPQLYFTDSNGLPLVGGKLYSYLAGTTTPTPTWTDESLQTPNTNPIVLDSTGACLCWLDSTILYKFVLTNSIDVLVWSQDNITGTGPDPAIALSSAVLAVYQGAFATDPTTRVGGGALQNGDLYFNTSSNQMKAYANGFWYATATAGATDAALVSFTPSGAGAVVNNVQTKLRQYVSQTDYNSDANYNLASAALTDRLDHVLRVATGTSNRLLSVKLAEAISVKDFGAIGDGVADDTPAFQNSPNGAYVPDGTYLVSSDITQKGFYRTGNASTTGVGNVVFLNSNTQLDRLYSQALPIGNVSPPIEFNDTLKLKRYYNGEFLEYLQNPYDVIDFTNNPDTAINSYYVNFVSGNNLNAGTSSGAAWKTLTYAFTTAVSPAIIYLEDYFIGTNSLSGTAPTLSGNFKIVGAHASGKTLMSSMNENYTKATFNWTDETNGCWSTSTATTTAIIFSRLGFACFDLKYPDQYGGAMPLPQAASSAACIATPGTQFHDVATSTKYVHLIDGREPDPYDDFIYSQARSGLVILQGAASGGCILLENIDYYMNAGAATTAACRYRHATTATNTSKYGVRNCLSYGASGNGFEVYDADVAVMDNCHAAYNHLDNFNYHSFQSTGTKGEYITVYEYKCTGWQPGYLGFVGQPAASTSANSSTCHDSSHIERASCNHGGGTGATIADVNGCVSVNWCIDSGPPIGGSPEACFWQENYLAAGTYNGMWLWGCSAHDDDNATVQLLNNTAQVGGSPNDGQIYAKYWRGKTSGAVVGTVKNFDGDNA